MLSRIMALSTKQSKLQSQIATGQRITQAEDDPAAAARVLTLNSESASLTQYSKNTTYALNFSNASYNALKSINSISDRAGELATLATGAMGTDSYDSYAAELNQLIDQGFQLVNSKFNGDSLFGGINLSEEAATRTPATGDITAITYNGSASPTPERSVPITDNSSINPGTTTATNQNLVTFLNHLVDLRDALKAKDTTAISTARDNLIGTDSTEGDANKLISAMSDLGAVQTRIEITQSLSKDRITSITGLISGEVDLELPEAITKLNQTSVAYQAALQSTSLIMNRSLLDYVK